MSETLTVPQNQEVAAVEPTDINEFLHAQLEYQPDSAQDAVDHLDALAQVKESIEAGNIPPSYVVNNEASATKKNLAELDAAVEVGLNKWRLTDTDRSDKEKVIQISFPGDVPANLKSKLQSLKKEGEPDHIALKRLKTEATRDLLLDREIAEIQVKEAEVKEKANVEAHAHEINDKFEKHLETFGDPTFFTEKDKLLAGMDTHVNAVLEASNVRGEDAKNMLATNLKASYHEKANEAAGEMASKAVDERRQYIMEHGGPEALPAILKREAEEAAAAQVAADKEAFQRRIHGSTYDERQAAKNSITTQETGVKVTDNRDEQNRLERPTEVSEKDWLRMSTANRKQAVANYAVGNADTTNPDTYESDIEKAHEDALKENAEEDYFRNTYGITGTQADAIPVEGQLEEFTKLRAQKQEADEKAAQTESDKVDAASSAQEVTETPVDTAEQSAPTRLTRRERVKNWFTNKKIVQNLVIRDAGNKERDPARGKRAAIIIGAVAVAGIGLKLADNIVRSKTGVGIFNPGSATSWNWGERFVAGTPVPKQDAIPAAPAINPDFFSGTPQTSTNTVDGSFFNGNGGNPVAEIATPAPVELKLSDGSSIWRETSHYLEANGYAHDDATIDRIADAVRGAGGLSETDAENLPVGYTFTIPPEILDSLTKLTTEDIS